MGNCCGTAQVESHTTSQRPLAEDDLYWVLSDLLESAYKKYGGDPTNQDIQHRAGLVFDHLAKEKQLTYEDLTKGLQQFRVVNEEQTGRIFAMVDSDGNNVVDRHEFVHFILDSTAQGATLQQMQRERQAIPNSPIFHGRANSVNYTGSIRSIPIGSLNRINEFLENDEDVLRIFGLGKQQRSLLHKQLNNNNSVQHFSVDFKKGKSKILRELIIVKKSALPGDRKVVRDVAPRRKYVEGKQRWASASDELLRYVDNGHTIDELFLSASEGRDFITFTQLRTLWVERKFFMGYNVAMLKLEFMKFANCFGHPSKVDSYKMTASQLKSMLEGSVENPQEAFSVEMKLNQSVYNEPDGIDENSETAVVSSKNLTWIHEHLVPRAIYMLEGDINETDLEKKIRFIFDKFDKDKDSRLSFDEMKAGFKSVFLSTEDDKQTKLLFDAIKPSDSDYIGPREFSTFIYAAAPKAAEEERQTEGAARVRVSIPRGTFKRIEEFLENAAEVCLRITNLSKSQRGAVHEMLKIHQDFIQHLSKDHPTDIGKRDLFIKKKSAEEKISVDAEEKISMGAGMHTVTGEMRVNQLRNALRNSKNLGLPPMRPFLEGHKRWASASDELLALEKQNYTFENVFHLFAGAAARRNENSAAPPARVVSSSSSSSSTSTSSSSSSSSSSIASSAGLSSANITYMDSFMTQDDFDICVNDLRLVEQSGYPKSILVLLFQNNSVPVQASDLSAGQVALMQSRSKAPAVPAGSAARVEVLNTRGFKSLLEGLVKVPLFSEQDTQGLVVTVYEEQAGGTD